MRLIWSRLQLIWSSVTYLEQNATSEQSVTLDVAEQKLKKLLEGFTHVT